jgi:hypothetical protein
MVVWQVPVMLLNFAILLFVGGVVGMLMDKAMRALESGAGLESDDVKVRISRCLAWRSLMMVDFYCCGIVCGICVPKLCACDALPLLSNFPECNLSLTGKFTVYGIMPVNQPLKVIFAVNTTRTLPNTSNWNS